MQLKRIGNNETVINLSDGTEVFFSYSTPVAAKLQDGDYVKTSEHFSRTTSRHITKWLEGVNAEEKSQDFFNTLISN